MEPGTPIRVVFELEAIVKDVEGLMELARASVREVHFEKDWEEAYPKGIEDALATLLMNASLATFPLDGPLDVRSSSSEIEEVPEAWWAKDSPD